MHVATVKITATPATIHQGNTVTLSAGATGAGSSAVPTGTVTFKAYGVIHTVTLSNGSGGYTYNDVESPVTGPITIEGDYSGDANYPAASGTTTVTVE